MIDRKRLVTIGATFLIAVGAGYVVQNGGASAKHVPPDVTQDKTAVPVSPVQLAGLLPRLPLDVVLPTATTRIQSDAKPRLIAANSAVETTILTDVPTPFFYPESCDVDLEAMAKPGAVIEIELDAPCYQNQRITIEHAGLEFSETTDAKGVFSVHMPALSEFAPFVVTFADGQSVQATTLGLTLEGYERSAISWSGGPGLHIHAMEFGATFDDPGHVWAHSQVAADQDGLTPGGRIIQLGNPDVLNPKLVEIYSIPGALLTGGQSVDLIVEANVTPETCGQVFAGRSLQLAADGSVSDAGIHLSLPTCDGHEGYLLLNNLFQNLNIARN